MSPTQTKTYVIVLVAIVVVAGVIAAAWWSGILNPPVEEEKLKIAMICSTPLESSFMPPMYDAISKFAELDGNVEWVVAEEVAYGEVERVLRDFCTDGYNIIFAHDAYGEAIARVAPDFPDTWILGSGGGGEPVPSVPNTGHIDVYLHEVAYLSGIIAGMMSQTNKIGVAAGYEIPNTMRYIHAMMLGARSVNPDMELLLTYIESWYDPQKTKESTIAQIEAGADFHVNDRVGTIEAVAEYEDVYAFGFFSDQWEAAPDHVITSMVWNLYPIVEDVVARYRDGRALLNTYYWGMAQGVSSLAPYHNLDSTVPQDVKDKVNEVTELIISGALDIPIIEEPWVG